MNRGKRNMGNSWKAALIVSCVSLVFGGCSGGDDSEVNDGVAGTAGTCETVAAASTWQAIQLGVFERYQCTGCHNDTITEGNLNLTGAKAWEDLVYAPSVSSMSGRKHRIFPGDHDARQLSAGSYRQEDTWRLLKK